LLAVERTFGGTKPKTQLLANGSSIVMVEGFASVSILAW
jgi:hypothetical protein